MAHGRLVFVMPARTTEAFEAFFNHSVRLRWDTLLSVNYVEGGGTHPYVGAISTNRGRGWKTGLTMRTRFLSYDPPHRASAKMVEPTGPFVLWAASMRFKDRENGGSDLIYTYSIKLRPRWVGVLFDWLADILFAWETRRRFKAMANYLWSGISSADDARCRRLPVASRSGHAVEPARRRDGRKRER